MIITEFDNPLTAEDARKIAFNNREDSYDREIFRTIMCGIKEAASWGKTRFITRSAPKDRTPSPHVQEVLRSLDYTVTEKRSYKWDSEKKLYTDKPDLDFEGREQFFLEITWG